MLIAHLLVEAGIRDPVVTVLRPVLQMDIPLRLPPLRYLQVLLTLPRAAAPILLPVPVIRLIFRQSTHQLQIPEPPMRIREHNRNITKRMAHRIPTTTDIGQTVVRLGRTLPNMREVVLGQLL